MKPFQLNFSQFISTLNPALRLLSLNIFLTDLLNFGMREPVSGCTAEDVHLTLRIAVCLGDVSTGINIWF